MLFILVEIKPPSPSPFLRTTLVLGSTPAFLSQGNTSYLLADVETLFGVEVNLAEPVV